MKYAALFALCLLCACSTPEQREAARQQQAQEDVETCRSYGFRPRSDGFRNCLLQLRIAREQRAYDYHYDGYYGPRFGSGIYYMHR